MSEPDCFLRYRIGYRILQPCLGCQRAALLRGILRRENPTSLERAVVLKWFYSLSRLSRRKTFVGGKCALPSHLLVSLVTRELKTARGHVMPPHQHVCNGLARPAHPVDESMLSRDGQRDMVKS